MTVLSVVGARPQFVKAFPVSTRLRRKHDAVLVHTGQHYDYSLSAVFFEEFGMPDPEYNLGVGSGTHAVQIGRMLRRLDPLVTEHDPDVVLVYGDTNSTLAGALVAANRETTLAHVEAGLRSDNWSMPEEVNRTLTDHCSDLLFTPCQRATERLHSEGIECGVHTTGDVMYDALTAMRDRIAAESSILDRLDHGPGEYVLATVHRAENTDDPDRLRRIVDGLDRLDLPVVFPAHPRTVAALEKEGYLATARRRLEIVDPVGYLDFLCLLDGAVAVATDSGGVQKEAMYLETPCVTLRDETEWIETVEAGWNVLVGADTDRIVTALETPPEPTTDPTPYGDGRAAEHIVDIISNAI